MYYALLTIILMEISLDFGGSTVDIVSWKGNDIVSAVSVENGSGNWNVELEKADKVYVTGGKSRFFNDETFGVPIVKIPEIDAIGYGGSFLNRRLEIGEKLLVVSMGTGTCMVSVDRGDESVVSIKHVGGTGVGGGTFVGLGKELLGISNIEELLKIASKGSAKGVDISVAEIVGGDIGRVSGDATASNLGKLNSEVAFKKEDLAAGIINLIGQTIGASAAFAAQAEGASKVVLTGKLTRAKAIVDVVEDILGNYNLEVLIPENAAYAVAIGARVAFGSESHLR